jgi:hypothetical protein
LAGTLAGTIAACVLATFPLDVIHATTLTNDILLSTFIWGGALLLVISWSHSSRIGGFLSGVIVGAAVAVKINALVAPAVLIVPLVVTSQQRRRDQYATIASWFAGWFLANSLLCLFMYHLSGDFFAHYHAEIRFNNDFNPSGYTPGRENLIRFLLYYPKLMIPFGHHEFYSYRFPPYGTVFLAFFLCLPLLKSSRFKALRLPAIYATIYLCIMQFMPLKIFPHYIPIHRFPRFLYIAAIPSVVTIGAASAELLRMKGRVVSVITGTVLFVVVSSSLGWAYRIADVYQDCSKDQQWAWTVVQSTPAGQIITDHEMGNYLKFRSGFSLTVHSPLHLPLQLPPDTLVLLGGARKPEIPPGYAEQWYNDSDLKWGTLVSEAPFALRPWRRSPLRIYTTNH